MSTCPSCGKENPNGFRFCGFCSAPLTGAPIAHTEERKVVSVLFCDLVGFTAHSERADPEDVSARLRPYHERLKREIETFGGTVEKFVGDAVMAIFGAPVSHEDDAERAVRAGLRILEAIEEMNIDDPSLGLSVRIGVNTGETVVDIDARPGRGEAMVAGDVVNTASRLQGAAPIGSVVVGESTHRATAPVFEWEEIEPVSLKGKAAPTALWRAVTARGRFGVDIMRTPTTPFIGREEDLSLLQHVYQRVLRERSIQLVTLVGEPGVGKSRLVSELFGFIDTLPELVTWRQGRCLPYGDGIAFWALGEIVKAQAGILTSDSPEDAAEKLRVATVGVPNDVDRTWIVQRLGPLVGIESTTTGERDENFTAWQRFLELIAADGPAVFVVEDLHWADASLIDFLEHLVEWAEVVPMLVVCTARPELYDRHPGWGGGKRNTTTINVSPLTEEETARLVQALLDTTVLPAEVQRAVLDRAGGNPLYAEEFVRMLKDRGLLVTRGRSVSLTEGAEIPVPDTVQALISARIDELTPNLKALLQDAAVVGKVFWSGAVAAIGERADTELRATLHELSKRELIRPARISSMADQAEFAFWHILVRDVVYGQIPRQGRITKHVAAARWIEDVAGERAADLADVIATHYWDALLLARATGMEDVSGLEEHARRNLIVAGERARVLDLTRAGELYERALSLTPDGHPDQARSLKDYAAIETRLGRVAHAESLLREAIDAAQKSGDVRMCAAVKSSLAEFMLSNLGDPERSSALYAEALSDLENDDASLEMAEVLSRIGGRAFMFGQFDQAIERSSEALKIFVDFPPSPESASNLATLGMSRLCLGDLAGEGEVREALAMAREVGLSPAMMQNNYGSVLWPLRGPREALEVVLEGAHLAERRGDRFTAAAAGSTSLDLLYGLGRWEEVLEGGLRLLKEADAVNPYDRTQIVSISSSVRVMRGLPSELTETDFERARGLRDVQVRAPFLAVTCLEASQRGDDATVASLLKDFELLKERDDPYFVAHLPRILRVCIAVDDIERAQRLVGSVQPRMLMHEHVIATGRAIVAEGRGEHEEAIQGYTDAAARWESFPSVPEHGYALLGLGRCELAIGISGSNDHLRAARKVFASLGARPLIAEVDALLGQASARSS